MNAQELPVYKQKERILDYLAKNQVIVVESPTGSGKTTQIPIILHEAGYDRNGLIGVTQPRRLAAVSVCGFISKQLAKTEPDIVGYKMRFDDTTSRNSKIKIMTDGILLQEMKLDPLLSQYTVLMVDEAHERSLNIDFVLGLLKRVLEERPEFKVIISSATLNTQVFSEYFNGCPIVRIDTSTYPVGLVYKPVKNPDNPDEILEAICDITGLVIDEKREGDILIFLPGEKLIKDCINNLLSQSWRRKIYLLPLYGRLSKDEQDMVFPPAPRGKTKIVVATNIAETSITIDGITTVIDSGLAKLNFYNPRTFTSSLLQKPISKASANQRKGRAGRTQAGTCYRLYDKNEFETRPLFTQEEIYRTDLSEVVLRMAELGIKDFESFDFISSPGRQGIIGAVESLRLLEALQEDNSLSEIGKLMVAFPLIPRHSRIIVEAILKYPEVLQDVVIGTSFLSCDSPYLLPQGEEVQARKAHHSFQDPSGDFVSYLKLFKAYTESPQKTKFCERYYLDDSAMAEIANVTQQLGMIVSDLQIPLSDHHDTSQYLKAIAKGLIQFVCIRNGKSSYRSLTTEKVEIHPGSVMFRQTPRYIVAGEIVKTSRLFARSVSELKKDWLKDISPALDKALHGFDAPKPESEKTRAIPGNRIKTGAIPGAGLAKDQDQDPNLQVSLAGKIFTLSPYKGKKKILLLSWEDIKTVLESKVDEDLIPNLANLRSALKTKDGSLVMEGERLSRLLSFCRWIDPQAPIPQECLKKSRLNLWENLDVLDRGLEGILRIGGLRKGKNLGFMCLYTNQEGLFWFKPTLAFSTALSESLASLEYLVDSVDPEKNPELAKRIGEYYRRLNKILDQI